jgi:hypothetical protein
VDLHAKCLAISMKVLGAGHPKTVESINDLEPDKEQLARGVRVVHPSRDSPSREAREIIARLHVYMG